MCIGLDWIVVCCVTLHCMTSSQYDRSCPFCNPKENKKTWEKSGEKEEEGKRQLRIRWDYLEGNDCTEEEFNARKQVHPENKGKYQWQVESDERKEYETGWVRNPKRLYIKGRRD